MKKLSILKNEQLLAYVQIVLGSLIGAVAYPLFLVPNHIAPGGLTGIATVLNFLFQWPVGTVSLIMNVPLFLLGYKSMGRVFAFRSLFATVIFSLLIDLIPMPSLTANPLLASLFGGVLLGAGLGLIIRGGATTGGTDMIARMVHSHFQHISMGALLTGIDCIVVLLAGLLIEMEYALYALVSIYVAGKMIDMVMLGLTTDKACYVISTQHEAIKQEIMTRMDRGVTVLSAEGGYSGEKRPILLCVMSAQEIGMLKALVRSVDERAFVFITEAHEVLGEGFRNLTDSRG